MFKALAAEEIAIVIDAMEEVRYAAGATVITQEEPGNVLYVVEEGQLDCYKKFNLEVS